VLSDNRAMKLRNATVALTASLCALVATPVAFAAPPSTTITVAVKNQHDKPVDNATVIIDFLGSHQVTKLGKRRLTHWEMKTNQQGLARFPPVPQGTIQLQVVAKQYQTSGNKYDVDTEAKNIDVQLSPPQDQYSAHPPLKPAEDSKH
jgi:Tfp pilus assembly protein PilX